jgi:hypothetical protein
MAQRPIEPQVRAAKEGGTPPFRGFNSPFAVFDGKVMCPHCGSVIARDVLSTRLRSVVTLEEGGDPETVLGVVCGKCHARGYVHG